jgi:hypothetical protein
MESHVKSNFRAIRSGLTRSKWWFRRPLILPIAKPRVHYIAALDEVTVTRDGEFARIEYKEGDIADALLEIGPEIVEMSDSEIVELHNEVLRDKAAQASEYKQVAIEMPLGSVQIEYFARCDQWVPRGSVLRCLVEHDEHGQVIVKIDEQELRLKQFGKLLTTYGGWGMRIEFVPQEEVHRRPVVEVREPTAE